jgi:uncharacterized protein YqgC (DUF456 family)
MSGAEVVPLVALAMAVGLVGTIVPVVPGLVLIWAAALGYGIAEGFDGAGAFFFGTITVMLLGGVVAGIVLPRRAAGSAGAGQWSVLLGAALGIAGFFVVPVVGLPLGGALGIYLGEHLRTRDPAMAWRATVATLKGFGLAALAQFGTGLAMVLLWVAWVVAT